MCHNDGLVDVSMMSPCPCYCQHKLCPSNSIKRVFYIAEITWTGLLYTKVTNNHYPYAQIMIHLQCATQQCLHATQLVTLLTPVTVIIDYIITVQTSKRV